LFFALLTISVAILISSVAAYYSIVGLMAIFAAAKIPIAIMGCVLEVGKLVVASWTFRNWKIAPNLLRLYFVIAILVLMFITSLGIFGFLSKAHLEQSTPTEPLQGQIKQLELKIEQKEQQKIRIETALSKLDIAFDKYLELGAVTKGLKSREETRDETTLLNGELEKVINEINDLNFSLFSIKNQLNMLEVEVGPIKYVASLFYDEVDNTKLEDSVRWIIILLILVFDPLAVVLIIAGNISLTEEKNKLKKNDEEYTLIDDEIYNRVITKDDILNITDEKDTKPVAIDNPPDENTVLIKKDNWIISQWKEKGFKSPKSYIAFLKKFS